MSDVGNSEQLARRLLVSRTTKLLVSTCHEFYFIFLAPIPEGQLGFYTVGVLFPLVYLFLPGSNDRGFYREREGGSLQV